MPWEERWLWTRESATVVFALRTTRGKELNIHSRREGRGDAWETAMALGAPRTN